MATKSIDLDVAIIGAGTAGLSAASEVKKVSSNFRIFEGGLHGTTCARVGCMPSKTLIESANTYYHRVNFDALGINGAKSLSLDRKRVFTRVRALRDFFVSGVLKSIERYGDRVVNEYVHFIEPGVLSTEAATYRAKKIVLACGSVPIVPEAWYAFNDRVWTTDALFEQDELPQRIGVVGLGVIGIELGQALSRLGFDITGFGSNQFVGHLTDPEINREAIHILSQEIDMNLGSRADLSEAGGNLLLEAGATKVTVDGVLASLGRKPNFKRMAIENAGVNLDQYGHPIFDPSTMATSNENVFIAGDFNGDRQILHEAADEGRIAGYNAARDGNHCFKRRTPLGIVFTDPNIVTVGKRYSELADGSFEVGTTSFNSQGRARIQMKNRGACHIYGDKKTGRIIGAEMIVPSGEHLGHLISWAVTQRLTAAEALSLPFYHPVVEEGLRSAIRDLARKLPEHVTDFELARCDASFEGALE